MQSITVSKLLIEQLIALSEKPTIDGMPALHARNAIAQYIIEQLKATYELSKDGDNEQ